MTDISPKPIQSGTKLPLRLMHVWGIRVRLRVQRRIRDLALFDVALDSKLWGCDVFSLRIGDVFAGVRLASVGHPESKMACFLAVRSCCRECP